MVNIVSYRYVFFSGDESETKYSHLKRLHKAIKLCEPALVSVDPTITSLGDKQEVSMQTNEMLH